MAQWQAAGRKEKQEEEEKGPQSMKAARFRETRLGLEAKMSRREKVIGERCKRKKQRRCPMQR